MLENAAAAVVDKMESPMADAAREAQRQATQVITLVQGGSQNSNILLCTASAGQVNSAMCYTTALL